MMKRWMTMIGATLLALTGACEKKSIGKAPAANTGEVGAPVEKAKPVATHLGIANRVPKDVDFFAAGYHASEMAREMVKEFVKSDEIKAEDQVKFEDAMSYVGDEMFVFVGPSAGEKIRMVGNTYRDLSAAWAGFAVGTMLDALAKKDTPPDFSKLGEGLSNGLIDQWMDALEKDSRLQVPSVVTGWKPAAGKEIECRDTLLKWLDEQLVTKKEVKVVKFETSGVAMTGFEITGREAFGDDIAKAREELAKNQESRELLEQVSPERIERLLSALENVRFTIASGVADGRVLIYLGNGAEGFRLAASPEESLAASDDLTWSSGFADKRIVGTIYLSESMVGSVLPMLDSSNYWYAVAKAIRPPVREERLFRQLLTGLADTERDLAKRDASAWSAVCFEDNGFRIETRGGWPDPSLDFSTPLQMTDAAISQKPAIRAHWIQQRGRKDLAWKRIEYFGVLMDSVIGELTAAEKPMMAMIPEGVLPRIIKEIRGLNSAYRDEFRAGIGDEVALIADFQGEVPPIPGISEESVKTAKAPRFIYARPVRDRAKLDAAGKSFSQSWRSLTELACEQSGENLPLIAPHSIESNGLVTWFPPLPFIGGDFIPGVTLNDKLWMLGTSRSMAGGFAKSMTSSGSGAETGMIVEIDFVPIRDWFTDIYQRNEAEAKALSEEAPDEMKELTGEENLNRINDAMRRLQGLSYHQWITDGKPRTSFHVRISPAK